MGYESGNITELFAEMKAVSANLRDGDAAMNGRIDGLAKSIDELYRRTGRPGFAGERNDGDERKGAAELCILKHQLDSPSDVKAYAPSSGEIDAALTYGKALKAILRHGDALRLEAGEFRKSLTQFSLGGSDFLVPVETSSRVLRCIVDPTDVTGLVSSEQISSAGIKFPIDNSRMNLAAWSCEATCFANNPQPDLQEGLGEVEIRVDPLRYIVCAGKSLLEDSAFNIENWIFRRAEQGYREALSTAILVGDGLGKPLGLLHPRSGLPVCETGATTAAGTFSWQDLVMLAYEIPVKWHSGSVYVMNQRTLAQILTMSDATGKPLLSALPQDVPGYRMAGFPIIIANQMPDVMPGSTPILFGNLREAYVLVLRRGLTMQPDPYTGGFCMLWRFDARVGGGPLCANACRLLRIR